MHSNRSLSPSSLRRLDQSPLDRKIRLLQEVSDAQSQQVRQLLLETNQPSQRSGSKPSIHPSPRVTHQEITQETARTRYHYEDFLEEQERKDKLKSERAVRNKVEERKMPEIRVDTFQNRQLDQQMQYLKSEDYHKYLEKVANGRPLPPKSHTPKRTHLAYIAEANRKTAYRATHSPNYPASIKPYRNAASPQNRAWEQQQMAHQRSLHIPSRKAAISQRQVTAQQYACERAQLTETKPPNTPRNRLEQRDSSYVLDHTPLPLKQEHLQDKFQKKVKKQRFDQYRPIKKPQAQRNATPISTQKESTPLKQTRIQTYRKQLEFCNREQYRAAKPTKLKPSSKGQNNTYRVRISIENQQNTPRSTSSSPSAPNPYEISFKIERNHHNKSAYQYNPSIEPKPQKKIHNKSHMPTQSTYQYQPAWTGYQYQPVRLNCQPVKRSHDKKGRVLTEHCCNELALQESHTNSTATKTDYPAARSRKISVVSKSKLK